MLARAYRPSETETRYDESGQVYTETVCLGTSMTADWKRKTRKKAPKIGDWRDHHRGCPTLSFLALRCCVLHSDAIEFDTIKSLPEALAEKLWVNIHRRGFDSIALHLAFARAFPRLIPCSHHVIKWPVYPISHYIQQIASPSILTHISLSNITTSASSLYTLRDCPNLSALVFGPGLWIDAVNVEMDDRFMRHFSFQTRTDVYDQPPMDNGPQRGSDCACDQAENAPVQAFQKLRALVLRQQSRVTLEGLKYLLHFPALVLIAAENCPHIRAADHRSSPFLATTTNKKDDNKHEDRWTSTQQQQTPGPRSYERWMWESGSGKGNTVLKYGVNQLCQEARTIAAELTDHSDQAGGTDNDDDDGRWPVFQFTIGSGDQQLNRDVQDYDLDIWHRERRRVLTQGKAQRRRRRRPFSDLAPPDGEQEPESEPPPPPLLSQQSREEEERRKKRHRPLNRLISKDVADLGSTLAEFG